MNKQNRILIFTLLFYMISFGWINWKTIETDKFQVIYKPGHESSAKECLKILEFYRPQVVNLTENNVGKTPIVIEDIGIMSSGYANPIFKNIHLSTYPPSIASQLDFCQSWLRTVSLHEYSHIAHLTSTGGFPKFLTTLLGTPFQPNIYSPVWLAEGIATYSESQVSPYEGRLNDGFFDAYISVCAAEHKFPSILDMTYLPFKYPYLNGRYIYGSKFIQFLAERYGPDKFSRLFRDNGSSILTYLTPVFPALGLDRSASAQYMGRNFPFLFTEWKYYELKKNKSWYIDGERLSKKGGTINFLTGEKNKLYYVREMIEKTGASKSFAFIDVVERDLNNQTEKIVVSLTTDITCGLKIIDNKLYYSALDMKKGFDNTSNLSFGYFANLHEKDLKTGKDKIILRDEFRTFTVLKDKKILYAIDKKQGFGSELYIYTPWSKLKEKIINTDFLIGEINSSDKYIVVSARKEWENWDMYFLDISSEFFTPILHTPYKESSIFINGNKIFFSANYDKVYSCFAYDIETEKLYKLTEGGYANCPVYSVFDSTIYFVGINSSGNDLYRKKVDFTINFIPQEYQKTESPVLSELSKNTIRGGYFNVLRTIFPAVHIPIILPTDTTLKKWVLGGLFMGQDAIGEHSYSGFFLLPTSSSDKPSLGIAYTSLFFVPLVSSVELNTSSPSLFLNVIYPFFYKPDAQFSRFEASLRGEMFDTKFCRKALLPYISSRFNFPKSNISSLGVFIMERKSFGSAINRNGIHFLSTIRRYIKKSELEINVQSFHDPDKPDGIGPLTRDPFDTLYVKTGASLSIDYTLPLFKIRTGFWNPNFYIEDFCISLFSDLAYEHKSKSRFFVGSEAKLETSVLFLDYARFIPKFGIGIDQEKQITFYFYLELKSRLAGELSPKQKIHSFSEGNRNYPLLRLQNLLLTKVNL